MQELLGGTLRCKMPGRCALTGRSRGGHRAGRRGGRPAGRSRGRAGRRTWQEARATKEQAAGRSGVSARAQPSSGRGHCAQKGAGGRGRARQPAAVRTCRRGGGRRTCGGRQTRRRNAASGMRRRRQACAQGGATNKLTQVQNQPTNGALLQLFKWCTGAHLSRPPPPPPAPPLGHSRAKWPIWGAGQQGRHGRGLGHKTRAVALQRCGTSR